MSRKWPRTYDPSGFDRWCDRSLEYARKHFAPVLVFRLGEIPAIGSGCIVRRNNCSYLMTAGHVVLPLKELGEEGRLQIGPDRFTLKDPLSRIEVRTSPDVAVMRLDEEEVRATRCVEHTLPNTCYRPERGRMAVCVGNLGATKALISSRELSMHRLQLFGVVDTVELDQFSIRVDPERYDLDPPPGQDGNEPEILDNGGISGAPIYAATRRPQIIGIVYEGMAWNSLQQKIYAVPASVLLDLRLFERADARFESRPPQAARDALTQRLYRVLPRVFKLRQAPVLEVHTVVEAVRLLGMLSDGDRARSPWKECGEALVLAANTDNDLALNLVADSLHRALLEVGWLDKD